MDVEELETLEGTVKKIKWKAPDSDFCIFFLKKEDEVYTAKGDMIGISQGNNLKLQGKWENDAKYGRQFRVTCFQQIMPEKKNEILEYLTAGTIEGMTDGIAKKLVQHFEEDVFRILEEEPDKLHKEAGISQKKAKVICDSYVKQISARHLISFLSMNHISVKFAPVLLKYYGDKAQKVVENNPYILTDEEYGMNFKKADELARQWKLDMESDSRFDAAMIFELKKLETEGHSCCPRDYLLDLTASLLHCPTESAVKIAKRLLKSGDIFENIIEKEIFYYSPDLEEAEENVSLRIFEMCQSEFTPPKNLEDIIEKIQEIQKIEYSQEQEEAIALAAESQVMILTGGPGTGKTTSMRGVLALFEALELETSLVAPTGRAAQRLGELCDRDASTIHRLLEVNMDSATNKLVFMRDENNLLEVDSIIVDETSMVDIKLMSSLLSALPSDCRLILVGDPDQLPSVGAGNLFADLISSGVIPKICLTEIFRQSQESNIVQYAHKINQGISLDFPTPKDGDFFFLSKADGEVEQTIVELCKTRLPEKQNVSFDQIQVISPSRSYGGGNIEILNKALQAALNPPSDEKGERQYGDWTYRTGDRVMQVKNNYDITWTSGLGEETGQGVFNGDIGFVETASSNLVVVNFEGKLVDYTVDMLPQLEPAFAVTVHKAQGSEYPVVIFAITEIPKKLRNRSILYTGITRAKQMFIAVGNRNLTNDIICSPPQKRFSGLCYRLILLSKG